MARLADTSEPRNRYKKAMKKVLRYVVELEYGDKEPASHQEVCPFTQDPAQELECHVGAESGFSASR